MPINKDTPTSEIIHDFVKSKNPKFAGKSKAERVKQAVAASYKVHGEEVEESNNTPYVRKSKTNPNAWDAMNKHGKVKTFGAEFKDSAMRHAGISEDVEQVDEISKSTLHSYMNKNEADREKLAGDIGLLKNGETAGDKTKQKDKLTKRIQMDMLASKKTFPNVGWDKPAKVNATEEVEQVDEEKPKKDFMSLFPARTDGPGKFTISDIENITKVKSSKNNIKKEETELDEARGRPKKDLGYTVNPNNKEKLYHDNPEHMDRIRRLRKNGVLPPEQHAPSEHIINRLRQASTNQTGGQDIKYENGKTHHVSGSMASKTLDHYNSLPKPADKEAFQAKIRKSHEEHKSALGEEVMSEETKAPLWGVSASNKFRTLDESVQIDELSKGTLGSYVKKATVDVHNNAYKAGKKEGSGKGFDQEKLMKGFGRQIGIQKAVTKLAKEEAELEEKKLIGKQKKLDKNHNDKLDAEDFKMLRKEELMDQFADALEEGIFDESDIDRLVENELEEMDKSPETKFDRAGQDRAKDKTATAIGTKKFVKDAEVAMNKAFSKEETISESVEPKVTPYTAANRYHAVESAVRDIMSQNQNLKKIAEEETFRRNNPGLFKDK